MESHPIGKNQRISGVLCNRIRRARRIAGLTQAELAKRTGTGTSAVAQWESPHGTSPTVEHLIEIAITCAVTFEWLATGRGPIRDDLSETPALDVGSFAMDESEDRLLVAYRRISARKRPIFVRWMEDFM
ncbi:MAG: helix-turn-helix transcriptional regulator [Rhodanobacteraceae bacterium]